MLSALFKRALVLVRFGNWWAHKIPPLLLVVYLELVRRGAGAWASVVAIAVLVWCVSCVAAYGHVINDWFDIDADALAGKPNTMRNVSVLRRAALCVGLVAGAFAPLAAFGDAWFARAMLAANLLWPTIYSLPGIRLKERGLWGVVCDAAGSHITPTIFALALAAIVVPGPANAAVAALLVVWATGLGIKGILYHQIGDRANDALSGTVTFAGSLETSHLGALCTRYNLGVELPLAVILTAVLVPFLPIAGLALAVYLAIEVTKYLLGFEFAVSSDARLRRRSVPFANEFFSTLWLPLAASVAVAALNPVLFWLPVLHALAFRGQAEIALADARAAFLQLRMRLNAGRAR